MSRYIFYICIMTHEVISASVVVIAQNSYLDREDIDRLSYLSYRISLIGIGFGLILFAILGVSLACYILLNPLTVY